MKTVTIYTDGACSGNPGPGGWCAILQYGANEKQLSGGEANTTNNRMELTAVIEALRALKAPCRVELWSDSKYVIDALEKGWARGWQKRGWVKSDKKPALNVDLWEELLTEIMRSTATGSRGTPRTNTTTAATSRPFWRVKSSNSAKKILYRFGTGFSFLLQFQKSGIAEGSPV